MRFRKIGRWIICLSAALTAGFIGCPREFDPVAGNDEQSRPAGVAFAEGMRFYFGNLHAHTNYSDGSGTPAEGYAWARDAAGFDFYAITDHGEQLTLSEWSDIGARADAFNRDGEFVTLRGFEYTNASAGHVNVLNTSSFTGSTAYRDLPGFYEWLDKNNGLAMFNHPGNPPCAFDAMAYSPRVADNFFGIETANKPSGNASNFYFPYYIAALEKNWKIGAVASQDNHSLSANSFRTVIPAPALTRAALLDALKAKRFYSSDDPSIKIVFRLGDSWMGSTVAGAAGVYTFTVSVEDNEPVSKIELIGNGAIAASQTCTGNQTIVVWQPSVTVTADACFHVKVTGEDVLDDDPAKAKQVAVTAPIWIDVPYAMQ